MLRNVTTSVSQLSGRGHSNNKANTSSARVLCTHNVGEGRSLIFTLVKGMLTIIRKGTNDSIEQMICACTIMI